MHRSCLALPPLAPIAPEDLISIINPSISFLSVPSCNVLLIGPYTDTIAPLLRQLSVPHPPSGRLTVPCLTRQIPAIEEFFPQVRVLQTSTLKAFAQASLRTVVLGPEAKFPYHLKFALFCRITSAIRTVTPWTASVGPEMSALMKRLFPAELWVYEEVAAVTGSQENFEEAKLITCLLRKNLEPRAEGLGQVLIVAAALAESGVDGRVSNAERVLMLDNEEKRKTWFRRSVPLFDQGIASMRCVDDD